MTEQQKSNYQLSKDDKMTYFPTKTFKLILAFCDDTLEEKQRKAHRWWKKQVNSAIFDLKVISENGRVEEAYDRGILHIWKKVFHFNSNSYRNVKQELEDDWIQNPTKKEWIEGYVELYCWDNMNLLTPQAFPDIFKDDRVACGGSI